MVKQFLRNSTSLLFKRQTTIISAAVIMMALVLASRVLGLVRNRFLAHYFPLETLDAYRAAFVLPDYIANVLITGALSVAFIPVFTTYISNRNEKEGWRVASSILNISIGFYLILALLVFLFSGPIIENFVVPGFKSDPVKLNLTKNITSIILISEILLIVGSFFTSVLQSFHRFIIPALAPVVYNIGIIVGILWLRPFLGLYGVAWGVVIGAILHILIQFFVVKRLGFSYKFKFNISDPGVLKIIRLSLPRALGIGLAQSELWVSVFLASLLVGSNSGSVAILGFAFDIQNFPIGLFGVTFATAALPTLSAEWAANKMEEFKTTFLSTLHQILYLTVPLSVLFIVLRIPIVRIMLGSGYFDWNSTVATAVTSSYFAIGVFANSSLLLLIRAFYSLHNAATPLKVAIFSLIFHAAVSSMLIFGFGDSLEIPVSSLGIAGTITGIFSFSTLLFLLDRKVGGFEKKKLFLPMLKIFLAAILMGVLLYLPLHIKINNSYVIDYIIDTTRVFNLLVLTSGAFVFGITIYVLVTAWLKSDELKTFTKLMPDLGGLQKFLTVEEKIESGSNQ